MRLRTKAEIREYKKRSKEWYALIPERSKGKCEGCLMQPAQQIHHRRFRSRGGLDNPDNLVHLCMECHSLAHSIGGEPLEGWAISRFEKRPESAVMFTDKMGTIWRFDTEGEKHVAPGGRPF